MTPSDDVRPATLFPDLEREPLATRPGILPSQYLRALVRSGGIRADSPLDEGQIQPASLDLRLGHVAYRVRASFLPGPEATVMQRINALEMDRIDLRGGATLERSCVYIVPLQESLKLPSYLAAKGNPKSTTGRLDVFTRLITDRCEEFEKVASGYTGPLYAEVVPRMFAIRVRTGVRLNQIRFFRGRPERADSHIRAVAREATLAYLSEENATRIQEGLLISVSLSPKDGRIGFRARANAPVVDIEKVDYYDVSDFWEEVHAPRTSGMILNPGEFYILGSRERVSIPPEYAAEMVAFDPSLGEFRIHYAGFFDPGFGYGGDGTMGAVAVLEVRAHEVPFFVEDGQVVGRLRFSQLIETPDCLYGKSIGSFYQFQCVMLSKQFRSSPTR